MAAPTEDLLAAALSAAGRGWPVFPIAPGQKAPPAVKDWEHRATSDPDRITAAWSARAWNIGVACGPAGLLVVDLDVPKPDTVPPAAWRLAGVHDGGDVLAVLAERAGQPLPVDTFTVGTPRGGQHLYFARPPDRDLTITTGQLGWLVDTRGAGGYVLAPGSTIGGRAYTGLVDMSPAPLPAWLADLLTKPARRGPTPGDLRTLLGGVTVRHRYAAQALRGELETVLAAGEGTRHRTLVQAAFKLGQLIAAGVLPPGLTEHALIDAGQAIGLPARECERTVRDGLAAGGQRPRQVPA